MIPLPQSDPFVRVKKGISDEAHRKIDLIKTTAMHLYNIFNGIPNGREIEIARQNLESSVMWAVKSIVRDSPQEFPRAPSDDSVEQKDEHVPGFLYAENGIIKMFNPKSPPSEQPKEEVKEFSCEAGEQLLGVITLKII